MARWDLQALLIGAIEAPDDAREAYRLPLARHGARAIIPLLAWVTHPDLAEFAIRTIASTAAFGAPNEARAALRFLAESGVEPRVVDLARRELGAVEVETDVAGGRPAAEPGSEPRRVRRLVRGRVYRRIELHAAGLGGNRQKGISYPADGHHALLFSGGRGGEQFGYRDAWETPDVYRYYGEWSGPGDMTLTGGNRAILDRNPNLYLFTADPPNARFEGRFRYVGHEAVDAARPDGRRGKAIVFRLERVADEVELA
ncbi:MAG TPA: hypothetical protein VNJ28_01880 [Candidatus Limnocylindrales bacterium]|nr:hypothetical protein [Candidatus Limnocylindrales bacterium]